MNISNWAMLSHTIRRNTRSFKNGNRFNEINLDEINVLENLNKITKFPEFEEQNYLHFFSIS